MAKKTLYNSSINEFIDWISGYDSLTNRQSITQPIGGKAIRELIQNHIRKPFYVFEDDVNHRKLLFSSKDSYQRWANSIKNNADIEESIPQKYKDLVLLNFDVPAPHTIYITNGNGGSLSTINIVDDGTTKGEINFRYYIDTLVGGPTSAADIKLTIIDPKTKLVRGSISRHQEAEFSNGSTTTTFFVADYLNTGENRIEIEISLTENLSAEPLKTTLVVNLIKFNIELLYQGSKSFNQPYRYDLNTRLFESLNFKVNCYKSIEETVKLELDIEVTEPGQNSYTLKIEDGSWKATSISKNLSIQNNFLASTYEDAISNNVQHSIIIKSRMYNDEGTINFHGNTLYYNFENKGLDANGDEYEIANSFINLAYSSTKYSIGDHGLVLVGSQYNSFKLKWGYYTDGPYTNVNVKWVTRQYTDNTKQTLVQDGETYIATLLGISGYESEELNFVPDKFYNEEANVYLCAIVYDEYSQKDKIIFETPIVIEESNFELVFQEYPGPILKLNAYGRTNSESENIINKWTYNSYSATFSTNFPFDSNNGWYNNALTLNDESCWVTINFNPFEDNNNNLSQRGRAIEIDFKTTNVANENHKLAIYGDESNNNPHIIIYPSKAVLYSGGNPILTTNYKSNERIQLMFIFVQKNDTSDPSAGNIYIVNNGVLERGVGGQNYTQLISNANENSIIKFGGTNSGIQIYNTRVWDNDMTIYEAFLNFLTDSQNKGTIISRNAVVKKGSEEPDYDACKEKIDTFLIEGDLSTILNAGASKDDSETAVIMKYSNPHNKNLGFTATNIKLRKHGQSTLNYPLTSFKMWLNKSKGENSQANVIFSEVYNSNNYVKNRYTMRQDSIPSNKFVLQANYADSSGVHNGAILRLINDTWYNANFGTESNPIYRLRTIPQLFTSGQRVTYNDTNINEDGRIEGNGNTDKIFGGLKANEHTWPELVRAMNSSLTDSEVRFRYKIRNAPDSTPCVVFYNNTKDPSAGNQYLGQFVFMDDKKSDHIYGERSIYLWESGNTTAGHDPFCMTDDGANTMVTNNSGVQKKGYDRDANCVWDNKNVLRIEVVLVNTTLTSFMDFNVSENIEYYTSEEIIAANNAYETDGVDSMTPEEQEAWLEAHPAYGKAAGDPKSDGTGNKPASGIKYINDDAGRSIPSKYYWEDYFEMIFPDEEDIAEDDAENGLTKFDPNSKFAKKAAPWITFLEWICSIGQLNKKPNGVDHYIDGTVTAAALNKFKAEAASHLDLYKIAAYYIFYIRFGLVDSVERNAQYKTYDGIHWLLEPWDMDIALGNKNTGGLVYEPPLNRDSRMPGSPNTWAYSGRSTATSNVLWDCLEAWDYWMNVIVPKTAEALYKAGLNYENITQMFDEEYANKWSELLYNNSGLYKYVTAAQDKAWLGWLQGSRTSHRHWWVSTSMNYYDSKWTCGAFNSSRLYLAVNKPYNEEVSISLWPTTETYFKMTQQDGKSAIDESINGGLKEANANTPAVFNLTPYAFSAKDPTHIFGVLFLEKLDLGKFANGIEKMIFQNAVDPILGATIKELNIGCTMTQHQGENYYDGWVNGGDISISNTSSINITDSSTDEGVSSDALENIETFNATGQLKVTSSTIISDNRTKLKNIYAAGTGFTVLNSSRQGNKYNVVQLPAYNITSDTHVTKNCVTSFDLANTSWNDISFWNCTYAEGTTPVELTDEHGNIVYETDDQGNQIIDENTNQPIPVMITPSQVAKYEKLEYVSNGETIPLIPRDFSAVEFKGSTAQNKCSAEFILQWFNSIEHYVRLDHPEWELTGNETEEEQAEKEEALEQEVLRIIRTQKHATIKNIRWNYGNNIIEGHPNFVYITYKDLIRLGNMNGGYNEQSNVSVNAGASYFTGYIKISGEEMESWQLAELMKLFGNDVFSINKINESLVIDQNLKYARITVAGGQAVGKNIYIEEGHNVSLKCTQFLLSSDIAANYNWSVIGENARTVTLKLGEGGVYEILNVHETTHNEPYVITLHAEHKNMENNIIADLDVYVNPVITSRKWSYMFVNSEETPRQFICDSTVAQSMFGNNWQTNYNNTQIQAPIYIIHKPNLNFEIALKSDINYSANIKNIKFNLYSVPGNAYSINQAIGSLDASDLINEEFQGSNYVINNEYDLLDIKGKCQSTESHSINYQLIPNSIKFASKGNFATYASNILLFTLSATVNYTSDSIDSQSYICNFMIYDDASQIANNSNNMGSSLINKLHTDYPNEAVKSILYKSDLLSIKGNLQITGDANHSIGHVHILGNNNVSIFDFMPNVQEIHFNNINWSSDYNNDIINGGRKVFDFSKLKKLEVLDLSYVGTGAAFDVDSTDSLTIQEIDLRTTYCNIKCKNNQSLTTLRLGSPFNIHIENCPALVYNNVSIESSNRINTEIGGSGGSITIINNDNINTYAYKLFDKLYNPTN